MPLLDLISLLASLEDYTTAIVAIGSMIALLFIVYNVSGGGRW